MEDNDQQTKIVFSVKGAWLGFIAYLVLILIVAAIFIWG